MSTLPSPLLPKEIMVRPGSQSLQSLDRMGSVPGTIFNLVNSVIGVGILALASAFKNTGLLVGLGLLVLCAVLTLATLMLLDKSLRLARESTFSGLMHSAVGPVAGTYTDIVIMMHTFGACVSYQIVIAGTLDDLLVQTGLITGSISPLIDNRQFYVLIVAICILWPLVMLPRIHFLRFFSFAANIAMVYVVVVVCLRGVQASLGVGGRAIPCPGDASAEPPIAPCNPIRLAIPPTTEFFNSFSTFMFAFATHTIVPPALAELSNPTRSRVLAIMFSVVVFSAVMYSVTATAGYLQYTDRVCANVTESFSDDLLIQIGQFGVIFSVMFGYPTLSFPLRESFELILLRLSSGADSAKRYRELNSSSRGWVLLARRAVLSTVLLSASTAIAFTVDNLGYVVELVGAWGSGNISFLLPTLAFVNLKHHRMTPWRRVATFEGIACVLSVILTFTSTALVIYNIVIDGDADGEDPCGESRSISRRRALKSGL